MKFLLVLMLVSVSANAAIQAGAVDAAKISDRKTLKCETERDLGKIGYRPVVPVVVGEKQSVEISFGIASVVCARSEKGLAWALRPLNDPFEATAKDGTVNVYAIKSSQAVILNSIGLPAAKAPLLNEEFQMFKQVIALDRLLDASELAALRGGLKISTKVIYYNHYGIGLKIPGSPAAISYIGGAYRFSFTLELDSNGFIKTSAVSLN